MSTEFNFKLSDVERYLTDADRAHLAMMKKRALEAEDLNRKFIAEINGPTHMGEPADGQA